MKKFISLCLLVLIPLTCLATNQLPKAKGLSDNSQFQFPKGCKTEGYEYLGNYVYLNSRQTDHSRLYLIYNQSDFTVLLDHMPKKDPGASAGWGSNIDAKHWSAIMVASDKKHFRMNCKLIKAGGKYVNANCSRVVRTCEYQHYSVNNAEMAQGGYWLAENHTLTGLLAKIKSRGVEVNTQ